MTINDLNDKKICERLVNIEKDCTHDSFTSEHEISHTVYDDKEYMIFLKDTVGVSPIKLSKKQFNDLRKFNFVTKENNCGVSLIVYTYTIKD